MKDLMQNPGRFNLTMVEVLLVLNLAARIGVESGRLPDLVFAGDESQTVRPTDFEWAWLNDLVKTTLPGSTIEDLALDVNLRSPSLLAEVVDSTRNHYRLLSKADRPAGQIRTQADDTVVGRVIYSTHSDDDYIDDLLDLAEQIPSCAIVYPGAALPPAVLAIDGDSVALSAADAKGLDYETVIVMEAGALLNRLHNALPDDGAHPQGAVRARSMADHFRVAVSRSSYNLVLTDRENHLASLEAMMGRSWSMPLETVSFADLHDELVGDADDEQLLRAVVDEVHDLMAVDTERALLRARSASRRLERLSRLQTVPSNLRSSVDRIRGLSAVLILADRSGSGVPASDDELRSEAEIHLEAAGILEPLSAYLRLVELEAGRIALTSWSDEATKIAEAATASRPDLAAIAPFTVDRLDRLLARWVRTVVEAPLDQVAKRATLPSVVQSTVHQLGDAYQHLTTDVDRALSRWAMTCLDGGHPNQGLEILALQKEVDRAVKAMCLEALGLCDVAMEEYLLAGMTAEAVRCARRSGQLDRAAQIHGAKTDAVARSIQLMRDLTSRLAALTDEQLLPEEVSRLSQDVDKLREGTGH